MSPDPATEPRVLRLAPDQMPRNHHGEPVAPLTRDGRPYRLRWVAHDDGGVLVYAETADDLLTDWIPGYQQADQPGRALLRAQHAVQIRDALVAEIALSAQAQALLSPEQEEILLCDLSQMPEIVRWDPPVPLVLLEGMYRPYTNLVPPLSGIDGDVREPHNIIWLRHAYSEPYLISLARAGAIDLAIHDG